MNVRKLKQRIEGLLDKQMGVIEEEEEDTEQENEPEVQFTNSDVTFNSVLDDLKSSGQSFSVETAFLSILHLCNEKQMKIKQNSDLDFSLVTPN